MGELFGQGVLELTPRDRCLSVAPLYSAYGLGNSLIFPMVAGAMAVLKSGRRTVSDLMHYLTGAAPAKGTPDRAVRRARGAVGAAGRSRVSR